MQDKLKEAADRAAGRATAPASPEQGKLATKLRAELEVHKEALATAKEEAASLASSLEKANLWIEVSGLSTRAEVQPNCAFMKCMMSEHATDTSCARPT